MRVASCPMGREIEGPPFVGCHRKDYHCVTVSVNNANNSK